MNRFEIAKLWQTTTPKEFLRTLLHNPSRLITETVAKYIRFLLSEIKKFAGYSVVSGIKGIIPSKKDKADPGYYDYTKTEDFDKQVKGLFRGLGMDDRYFSEAYQKQYAVIKEMLLEEYKDDKELQEYVMDSVCLTDEGNFQYSKPSEVENGPEVKVELYIFTAKERIALEEYAYEKGYSKEELGNAILKETSNHTIYDATNEVVNEFYVKMLLDRYAGEREEDNAQADEYSEAEEYSSEASGEHQVSIDDVKECMRNLGFPYECVESVCEKEDGSFEYTDFTGETGGQNVAFGEFITDLRLLEIQVQGVGIKEKELETLEVDGEELEKSRLEIKGQLQKLYDESSLNYDEFTKILEQQGVHMELNPEKNSPERVFMPTHVPFVWLSKEDMQSFEKYALTVGKTEEQIAGWILDTRITGQAAKMQSEKIVMLGGGLLPLVIEWREFVKREEELHETLDIDAENPSNEWHRVREDENGEVKENLQEKLFSNPEKASDYKVSFTIETPLRGRETDTHIAIRMPRGYYQKSEGGDKKFIETSAEHWGKYVLIPKACARDLNKHSTEIILDMGQAFTLCDENGNIIYRDNEQKNPLTMSSLAVIKHYKITKVMEPTATVPANSILIDGVQMEKATTKSGFVFAYSKAKKVAVLLDYKGTETDVKIPAEIKVKDEIYAVKEIKDGVFEDLPVESISIPDTIVEIRNNVCKNCTKLRTVKMSKNIQEMGSQVFRGCISLEEIRMQPGEHACVTGNSLILKKDKGDVLYIHAPNTTERAIEIPSSVKVIGEYAFEDSSIEKAILPAGVVRVSDYAFSGCTKLKEIEMPQSVKEIGSSAFRYTRSLNEVSLNDVEIIGSRAFSDSGIREVDLNSVTEVGEYAFERCFSMQSARVNTGKLTNETYAATAFANNGPLNVEFYSDNGRKPVWIGPHNEEEIMEYITNYLNQKLSEIGQPDLEIVNMCLYGSRAYGNETEESDLDVLLEYKGSINEDTLFNILHEDDITIEGIKVDINPITAEKSGTLEAYLEEHKNYDKREINRQNLLDRVNSAFGLQTNTLEDALDTLIELGATQQELPDDAGSLIEEYIKEIRESGVLQVTSAVFIEPQDILVESEIDTELQAVERALYLSKMDGIDAEINNNQEVYFYLGNKVMKGKELYDYLISKLKEVSREENADSSKSELIKQLESYSESHNMALDYKGLANTVVDQVEHMLYDDARRLNYYERELLVEYATLTKLGDLPAFNELVKQLASEGYGVGFINALSPNPKLVSIVEKERLKHINVERSKEQPAEIDSIAALPEEEDVDVHEDKTSNIPNNTEDAPAVTNETEMTPYQRLKENLNKQLAIVSGYKEKYSKEERLNGNVKLEYASEREKLLNLTNEYIVYNLGKFFADEKVGDLAKGVYESHAGELGKAISKVGATVDDVNKVIEAMLIEIDEKIEERDKQDSFFENANKSVSSEQTEVEDTKPMTGESPIQKGREKEHETEAEPEIQEPTGLTVENEIQTEDEVEKEDIESAEAERQTSPTEERLEDFGEKIGGARKDMWRSRGLSIIDMDEMNAAERQKYVTKDNVWKKPDYVALVEEGLPVEVAYFRKKVRDAVKTSPNIISYYDKTEESVEEKQKQYIEFVTNVRQAVANVKTIEDVLHFKDTFLRDGGYINYENRYRPSPTGKCYGLMDNKLFRAMSVSDYDIRKWEVEIKNNQFGVPPEKKLPAGIIIQKNKEGSYHNGKPVNPETWYIAKGRYILADEIKTYEEALKLAKEIGKKAKGTAKKALVPPQLEHIQRLGLQENLQGRNATGEMYMSVFGFRGGEYGNWMSEKDRQASLNMGYEALCDLALALNISRKDIALNNRLSIAFGARGKGGTDSAVAHYEPEREVINLTKMRGAGSLAHEWGHALDFISRDTKRPTEPVSKVLEKLKFREATKEEKQAHTRSLIEKYEKMLLGQLRVMIPESRLTQEQCLERTELIEAALRNPTHEAIEKLSAFKKKVLGHVITKADRDTLTSIATSLYWTLKREEDYPLRMHTEYYKSAHKLDELCSKCDKGYWTSDEELFARAFACYVNDKLAEIGAQSDYLCGHCQSCVILDTDKNGEMVVVKGYPTGQERQLFNECLEQMVREYKAMGYLHDPEVEREKPVEQPTQEEVDEPNHQYELEL